MSLAGLLRIAHSDPEGGKYRLALYKADGMCWTRRGACDIKPPSAGVERTLADLMACCLAWEPNVCVMGNVRAADAANAISLALDLLSQRTK